ncbi:MAG: tetratricopeptide repeat protein [bacterium]
MDILERLYRQIGAWAELAQILRARVELTTDPDEQIELWRKLGELYEMQMGQVDDAIAAYNAILRIDPSDILAIESLERIFEAYDRWQSLVDVLGQKASATYDPDEIVAIRYRMAQVLEERLQDVPQTIATYQQILEVDQGHTDSLVQLERLFIQTQNWHELLGVYEQQLQLTHEPSEQLAIYSKMASLNENQFEDINSAIEAYNNILMVDPNHLGAIENLERLYRGQENWFDLSEVLQRHAEATPNDVGAQVRALNELGEIQRDQISDPNAAIDAFNRSLAVIRQQPSVWRALADLYDETANWHSAVQALNEEASFTADPEQKVQILNRIGFMHEANLQDDVEAERVYQTALGLVPSNDASIFALRDLYARRGDFQGVIRILKHAEGVARDLKAKAEYLCEIGKVYDRELNDSVSATHYYESALECDPTVLDAAEPLIDMYINEKRWERAMPLLIQVLERRAERDPEDMHRRSVQMARVAMELGQEEQALASFRQAYEMDPTDPETLKGLSELLYRRGDWDQSFKIYQALAFNHAATLEPDELRDIYLRSGDIKQRVGERPKAIQFFQKALEFDGYFVPALTSLAENYEAEGNWRELVQTLRTLTQAEGQDTIRFANLVRIGDIWLSKLNDSGAATEAYLEALDIEPDSVTILRKLLDIFTKQRQWTEAVDMLNRLISMETDGGRKSKYLYTVGVILRDEIGDRTEAVNVFDQALDSDVRMLKAFEAIDRILTEEKVWKDLERAYRRMLRRVAENDDGSMEGIKTLLWQNLGEIYRSRLGHLKSAIQAYEAAVGLKPEDEKLRLILAELYERSEDNPDGAITQHKELIKLDPFRIDSYRALWKSYMQKKEYDKAWCMSGALVFLQNANEQEQKFYSQYLGQNLRLAKGQLNQELIKMVYHPEQDMLISFIMSILGQGLRPAYASDIKEWGLHKKKDLLSQDEQLMFTKIYSYSARTQAIMPAPALYLRRDQALGMRNGNVEPPAFVIGGDMMQGKSDRELAFTVSRQLCLARPEHYLASTPFPTEVLKLFFMAAMHITDPSLGIGPSLGEQGEVWIREIQRIPGPMLMQLSKFMKQYLAKKENPNLSEWLSAVDHTASRVGLLLCGDLQQAASCIKNDLNPIGKTSIKEKIREMVLFSISDEYFELRRQLGLSIENR